MATSQAQLNEGTWLKFNGEAGADVEFNMEGVGDTNWRISAQHDLGASPRDYLFQWYAELLMQANPTQYTTVDFYAAPAPGHDSTAIWGDVGATADTSDRTDEDALLNLIKLGSVVIEEGDTTKMISGGFIVYPYRYISIAGHNNGTGAAINATDSNFLFYLGPYNIQGQAT